jgi:hypothetical protein
MGRAAVRVGRDYVVIEEDIAEESIYICSAATPSIRTVVRARDIA